MPAWTDLTGKRLGRLVVLDDERGETHVRCHCDCGREEVYLRRTVSRYEECSYCRGTDCPICNTRIPVSNPQKVTCSPECKAIYDRQRNVKHYHQVRKHNPNYQSYEAERQAKIKERRQNDPEFRAKVLEREKLAAEQKKAKMLANPELHERHLARLREIWHAHKAERLLPIRRAKAAANRDKINAYNRLYRHNMSPEQKEEAYQKRREALEVLRDNKEAYAEYKARYAERAAQRRLEVQALRLSAELASRQEE